MIPYQMAGQTETVTRAVHDDVLDDAKRRRVFVRKQVLWIGQTGQITQPAKTHKTNRYSVPNSLVALSVKQRAKNLVCCQQIISDTGYAELDCRQPEAPSASHCLPGEICVRQVHVGADDAVSDEFLLEGAEGVSLQQIQSIQQLGRHMTTDRQTDEAKHLLVFTHNS